MQAINGFGTMLYGNDLIDEHDIKRVSTKWIVALYVPIIPLQSYVIKSQSESKTTLLPPGSKTEYALVPIPMYWKQVKKIYLSVYSGMVIYVSLYFYFIHDNGLAFGATVITTVLYLIFLRRVAGAF